MVAGMTVYSATSRADNTKGVTTRKGKIVSVNKMGRSYIVQWDDSDKPDAQPWLTSNLSFSAPRG